MTAVSRPDPTSLHAAALPGYADDYGASVLELDRALAAAPGPPDLIDLTHGDTRAFPPPGIAAADLVTAVRDNDEAYTAYRGSATLRAGLAPRLGALLGRAVDASTQLIVTPGTQGGLFAALSSLVGHGDVVALPDPDYFMSERIVAYLGARAVRLALQVAPDGRLTLSEGSLARATDARLLLLSHPNNPTGGVYGPDMVRALARWVHAGDRICVVDQLYCRQLFDGAAFTHMCALPGMAERTVTLIGPSKTESMSGYRVGVAVAPPDTIDAMERVLAMASLRTTAYAQQVLRHWLDGDGDWIARRTAAHQALRDRLVALLRAIPGVTVASPLGSSYVFPDVSGSAWAVAAGDQPRGDALAITLKAAGVLINPGYQFGRGATTRFRINFSQDAARLWEACARIRRVLDGT
ncbi:MAG TPA: aminotransferase class I/II-fold pyridoxal phosphate-dependent enzyme [Solirubrobacteraceae bacterium]|nr:aminotransferase class I/II-fold pyridoxal phosphate-dependent enzyme [Solirubrobacteraceae bacterium]